MPNELFSLILLRQLSRSRQYAVPQAIALLAAISLAIFRPARGEEILRDGFDDVGLAGWRIREGAWGVTNGAITAGTGFSVLLREKETFKNGVIEADVAYEHDAPFAGSGIL